MSFPTLSNPYDSDEVSHKVTVRIGRDDWKLIKHLALARGSIANIMARLYKTLADEIKLNPINPDDPDAVLKLAQLVQRIQFRSSHGDRLSGGGDYERRTTSPACPPHTGTPYESCGTSQCSQGDSAQSVGNQEQQVETLA